MIIEAIINIFIGLIKIIFAFINIPNLPDDLLNRVSEFLALIYNNLSFLGFFVRPITLLLAFDIVIAVWVFVRLYKITVWIIRKLPMSVD